MPIEETLERLGMPLPAAARPLASYVPAVRTGNLVFCSGQLPVEAGELRHPGRVGEDVGEDDARAAARIAALNCLAALKTVIGDLDAITRIVRVTGYVSSGSGFTNQPAVVNGASDFLLEVFGEIGQHSRAAIGVCQLPRNACVEIDMIVEVSG
ncbi:MAG: RidA family protein [Chloroflexi bacterium]|nr:RidA family protein [Chloroflexota bacterium]